MKEVVTRRASACGVGCDAAAVAATAGAGMRLLHQSLWWGRAACCWCGGQCECMSVAVLFALIRT